MVASAAADEARNVRRRRVVKRKIMEAIVPLTALILLIVVFGLLTPDKFLTYRNVTIILQQSAVVAVIAFGMTFVIVGGSIDLSVGSVVALAGMIGAAVAQQLGAAAGVTAGLITGGMCGAVNGLVFAYGRIPSFIATLGMLFIARGLAILYSNANPIRVRGSYEGLGSYPNIILAVAVTFVILYVIFSHTKFGRYVQAIGGNEVAARANGVPVNLVKVAMLVLSGALAGLGGILLSARLGAATPTAGLMFELDAISAVVLGGTPLTGGLGNVQRTVIGALITATLINGLVINGVSSEAQVVIRGVILIIAVIVSLDRTKIGVIK